MATMKRISIQNTLKLPVAISAHEAFEGKTPTLPINLQTKFLKEAQQLTRLTVSSFADEVADEVSKLSDEVTSQASVASMGEFGQGMTQILVLTQKVDPMKLGADTSGFLGKIKRFFIQTKEQVLAQYESVSKDIERVEETVSTHISAMTDQNTFLERMYGANEREYQNLEAAIRALERVKEEANDKLEQMEAATGGKDGMMLQAIVDQKDLVDKFDIRLDQLRRLQHVALLTAPEIRDIQNGNLGCVNKFQAIKITLSAWKKQLSLVILSLKQKEEVELGNLIDDKTNEFFNKAADLTGQNRVAVAKLSQRSVLDMSTLEHMQQVLIASTREAKEIAKAGEEDRANAVKRIAEMRGELKNEFNPTSSARGMQPVKALR